MTLALLNMLLYLHLIDSLRYSVGVVIHQNISAEFFFNMLLYSFIYFILNIIPKISCQLDFIESYN